MEYKLIKSYAHEIVQCVPLSDKKYKCVRCSMVGSLKDLFSKDKKCTPHFESITSGWSGEIISFEIKDDLVKRLKRSGEQPPKETE